jgi:hypothetical protein
VHIRPGTATTSTNASHGAHYGASAGIFADELRDLGSAKPIARDASRHA